MSAAALPGVPAGLSGYALIAVLCTLLFVEEIGIPLPFAPGDLVLIVLGITVSSNQLSLPLVAAAAAASVIAGAAAGREIFAGLGSKVVYRIADVLHVRRMLDKIASSLIRQGARAVFIGRLTPGLRVHTTEAAGLVQMPRRSFLKGHVPAVLVYEGVFLGLGYWLGPQAGQLVHRFTVPVLALIATVAIGLAAVAGVRWLIGDQHLRPSLVRESESRAIARFSSLSAMFRNLHGLQSGGVRDRANSKPEVTE